MSFFSCFSFWSSPPPRLPEQPPIPQRMIVLEMIETDLTRRTQLIETLNKQEQIAYDEGKVHSLLVKFNENVYYDLRVRDSANRLLDVRIAQAENLNYVAILRQIKTLIEHTEIVDRNDVDRLAQELRTRIDHLDEHKKILTALFEFGFTTNYESILSETTLTDPVVSSQTQKTRKTNIDKLIEECFYNKVRHFASSPKPVR